MRNTECQLSIFRYFALRTYPAQERLRTGYSVLKHVLKHFLKYHIQILLQHIGM